MTDSPLTGEQRDSLIRTMTAQGKRDAETIAELQAELVALAEENAALKAGVFPDQPFTGGSAASLKDLV